MPSPSKVEELYEGDVRLDNLEKDIISYIHKRVGDTDITYVAVIGLLEVIKYKLTKQLGHSDY